jgi:hypothetical protein
MLKNKHNLLQTGSVPFSAEMIGRHYSVGSWGGGGAGGWVKT